MKNFYLSADYTLAYIVSDALMFVSFVLIIWKLKVSAEKSESNQVKVSKTRTLTHLFSLPMLIFMLGLATTGMIFGINNTYLYLYLQRDLSASSKIISYMVSLGLGVQALFLFVSDLVVEKVGHANSISVNIFIEVLKLFLYANVQQSPPYYAFGLHVLNFSLWGYSYVAALKYAYLITPPDLVGTITSIVMVFITVISTLKFWQKMDKVL